MKALSFIEIDIPTFNAVYPEEIVTYRFSKSTAYLPRDIDCFPSIKSINYSPSRVSLGQNLGERASLTVSLGDHRHIFDGEAFESGTFWGKWRARYGTKLRGRALRWVQGILGQELSEMQTRHFIIESTDGPSTDGTYTIVAKDILKLADNDRAQAPALSNGFIVSTIDADDASATLAPTGIGAVEYPASGYVAIGGSEICSFTRSGNTLTLTGRGALGTSATAHEAGERAQLVLQFSGEDPGDIIRELLVDYAGVNSDYINIAAWNTETESYLQTLYSANISEPTSVNKLISELVEQAALAVWWEPETPTMRLKVLRKIDTTAATFDHYNTLSGSLRMKEQPGSRISQVWTYFGQRNSLRPVDEPDNYMSVALTANLEAETEYGSAVIKKIFSRWIPFGARSVALRLNDLLLGRFTDPPRQCNFNLWKYGQETPMLGAGFQLRSWVLQNVDGTELSIPIQITRVNPTEDQYEVEADEMLAGEILPTDLTNRTIVIDGSVNNVNLRTMHDLIYPVVTGDESPEVTLKVYIEENVIVGSSSTSLTAFTVGSWPVGFSITIYVRGRIQGAGGRGGTGAQVGGSPTSGTSGGRAFYTRKAVTLVLNQGSGEIWGGGGGGGGADDRNGDLQMSSGQAGGGGGGSGSVSGSGGDASGMPGTTEAGGSGGEVGKFDGGDGGDPGQAGSSGIGDSPGAGGAAGGAIDGVSYVTKTGVGSILGSQVN